MIFQLPVAFLMQTREESQKKKKKTRSQVPSDRFFLSAFPLQREKRETHHTKPPWHQIQRTTRWWWKLKKRASLPPLIADQSESMVVGIEPKFLRTLVQKKTEQHWNNKRDTGGILFLDAFGCFLVIRICQFGCCFHMFFFCLRLFFSCSKEPDFFCLGTLQKSPILRSLPK